MNETETETAMVDEMRGLLRWALAADDEYAKKNGGQSLIGTYWRAKAEACLPSSQEG